MTVTGAETAGAVEELCVRTGFSRFPVLVDGRLTGYLHVKDLITGGQEADEPLPRGAVRRLARVEGHQPLAEVLSAMQGMGAHMAAVGGADGEPSGVVALEDVLEELVGQVHDATNHEHGGSRRISRRGGASPKNA